MVVVVIPLTVVETSLTTVFVVEVPPLDPLPPVAADWDDPDWDDALVVVEDAAVAEEEAMAEIDMESSRVGNIDESRAGWPSASPLNAARPRSRRGKWRRTGCSN